jgi:hypothetical protein
MMFEWPPDWTFFFALVAFLAASVAVRGWRDLFFLVLLTALLALPLKLIGSVLGLAAFAEPMLIHENTPKNFRVGLNPTAALVAANILGSLVMIAWKSFVANSAASGGSPDANH